MKRQQKVAEYQEKFMTQEEATKDAKSQSRKLGIPLHVIQSRGLFYVYSNSRIWDWETLLSTYEDGKKVKNWTAILYAKNKFVLNNDMITSCRFPVGKWHEVFLLSMCCQVEIHLSKSGSNNSSSLLPAPKKNVYNGPYNIDQYNSYFGAKGKRAAKIFKQHIAENGHIINRRNIVCQKT